MQDKIIARRHNSYRLKTAAVLEVDAGRGLPKEAGIGPSTQENVKLLWDDGETGRIVRRFPVDTLPQQRLYMLMVESGVSAHPERPVFLFNSANGQQHREENAPPARNRFQLATDRLPILLAILVAVAFMSIYSQRAGMLAHGLVLALGAVCAALIVTWGVFLWLDLIQNRLRRERVEDEQSAAKESVQYINEDVQRRQDERVAAAATAATDPQDVEEAKED